MEYLIICLTAFVASGLTLFSGFGLGAFLLPVFAIFFPLPTAVALTAIVHFLNNLFKLALFYKHTDKGVIVRFGLLAIPASFLGALSLSWISDTNPILTYQLLNHDFHIMPVNLILAILIMFFALWEVLPKLSRLSFDRKYLPLGGILSGFFGGLSGQQGVLRTAFLIKCGLSKESFIASGVVIACLVDIVRIPVYVASFSRINSDNNLLLLLAATLSAFAAAFIANRWLKKLRMSFIKILVAIMLFGMSLALGFGII
jgi:uncharacterized protein